MKMMKTMNDGDDVAVDVDVVGFYYLQMASVLCDR